MSACGKDMSAERRRLVALGGSLATFSVSSAVIGRHHPHVAAVGMVFVVAMLLYVLVATVQLRRKEGGE